MSVPDVRKAIRLSARALAWAGMCLACEGRADSLSADEKEAPLHARPLWEAGLFNGAARIPHYRGSDEYSTYLAPIPYFLYRGEVIRSGRDGARGILFTRDRLQMDIAVSGSPPVPDDNDARAGMHDIGAILELGPALRYDILGRASPDTLFLRGAVRGAVAFDVYDNMNASAEGFRATVDVSYRNRTLFEDAALTFGGRVAIDVFSDEYSAYLYSVSDGEALPSRPRYEAEGGYAGLSVSAYATKELNKRFSLAAFFSWINLTGATFEDSPVVRTDNNVVAGCAVIWNLYESKRMAPVSNNL